MLKSASLVTFWFLFGFAFMCGMNAHSIITSPLAATPSVSQIDARSVCVTANQVRSVPDCRAFTWTKSVSFNLDTSATEAAKMCAAVASRTSGFAGTGWSIRIYSPFATAPIATCSLN